jgi:hypothetical protein
MTVHEQVPVEFDDKAKEDAPEKVTLRPQRRIELDPPLTRPAGRRIRFINEDAYELVDFP